MNDLILTHYRFDTDIAIPSSRFFTLSVENKDLLLRVISSLRTQTEEGKEGDFHILIKDKEVDFEKSAACIFDFSDINFNTKPINMLLLKKFADFLGLGEQAGALNNIESVLLNLAEGFRLHSGINIDYDASVDGVSLAKVCSLRIADKEQTLLARLTEYVNLLCDLKPLKLIVLVFAKSFLTESGIAAFHKHCGDKEVRLLLIEGKDSAAPLPVERRLIIDADLCAIPQNFDG